MKLIQTSKKTVVLVALAVFTSSIHAQTCNCDTTYSPNANGGTTIASVSEGSTICLLPGHYSRLFIRAIGTASAPIVITNCGGEVTVGGATVTGGAIKLFNTKHVRLLGNGDPGISNGIKIVGTADGNSGLIIQGSSSDIEVAHLEIFNTGFAGIQDNPGNLNGFVRDNLRIHRNHIHDTEGEGIYIGSTSIDPLAAEFHNLQVYDNLIEDTGWDGVQIARATSGTRFYGNIIRRTGLTTGSVAQRKGLQIGKATSGDFYNNWIEDPGQGDHGLIILGDDVKFFNNVIIGGGVFCTEPLASFNYTRYALFNNTFIKTEGSVFETRNGKVENLFVNNLAFNNTTKSHLIARLNSNSSTNPMPTISSNANLFSSEITSLGLVDPDNHNFRLTFSSAAADAGIDLSHEGVIDDYEGNMRPQNQSYDIGAFETLISPMELSLEAECGVIGSNWQLSIDSAASGNQFVVYPDPNGIFKEAPPSDPSDHLTYSFDIPISGNYYLLARIKALNVAFNSFWVKIDDQPWVEWWEGMVLGDQFFWNELPGSSFPLSKGNHTITFANRERGTKLDKLLISPSNIIPLGFGEQAINCSSSLDNRNANTKNTSTGLLTGDFSVYPNPCDKYLIIHFDDSFYFQNFFQLMDHSGKVVKKISPNFIENNRIKIDTRALKPGMYVLRSTKNQVRSQNIYIRRE